MATVELVLVRTSEARHNRKQINLPVYDVVLDGKVVGRVERAMLTRERRTPGRRYVNARWQSPGWRYRAGSILSSRMWEVDSRRYGIERVLREAEAGLSWAEAETLSTQAKVRKAVQS